MVTYFEPTRVPRICSAIQRKASGSFPFVPSQSPHHPDGGGRTVANAYSPRSSDSHRRIYKRAMPLFLSLGRLLTRVTEYIFRAAFGHRIAFKLEFLFSDAFAIPPFVSPPLRSSSGLSRECKKSFPPMIPHPYLGTSLRGALPLQ